MLIFEVNSKVINSKEPPKKINSFDSKNELNAKTNININININNGTQSLQQQNLKNTKKKRRKLKKKSKKPFSIKGLDSFQNFVKKEWIQELHSLKKSKVKHINILNEQELNTLDYELAIETDNRTYFEYYWSLLKKKHLILFTFIPMTDYNLHCIKISLLLISFSLSFTINAFFFDDETMHKIYVYKGTFNFFNQIAQILYSTLICTFINTTLRLLSLSENKILEIKKEETLYNILYFSCSFIIIFLVFYFLFLCCI